MSESVMDLQQRVIRAMGPEAKIRVSEALRAAAWQLKAAWIRNQQPGLPEPEVQEVVRRWFRESGD